MSAVHHCGTCAADTARVVGANCPLSWCPECGTLMEWDTSVPASHARIAALTQERDEEHERWIDAEHQAGTLRLQVIQRDQRIAELESTVAAQRTTIWELRAIVRGEEP